MLLNSCLPDYPRVTPREIGLITSEVDIREKLLEDLVAIPDLACGALVQVLTEWSECIDVMRLGISVPVPKDLTSKAKDILKWLEKEDQALKRLFLVIDEDPSSNNLRAMVLKFHTEQTGVSK